MTLRMHRIYGFIRLLLLSLMFPWGGLCGGRDEVLTNGWTLDLLIERYNQDEKAVLALDQELPPSKNWGGAVPYFCRLLSMVEKLGDRAALPFLEEKSFMTSAPATLRSRATIAYVNIADAEECIEFMRKTFGINDDEGYWRFRVTPLFLEKMEAAIANRSVSDETTEQLLSLLMAHTQTTSYSREASWVDDFLVKHCHGYRISEQRLSLWSRILDEDKENELKRKNYLPIREAIEAIPPRQRIDLRKRFPGLPPLPDDAPTGGHAKVAITAAVGILAVVAAWLALRRRKAREAT